VILVGKDKTENLQADKHYALFWLTQPEKAKAQLIKGIFIGVRIAGTAILSHVSIL